MSFRCFVRKETGCCTYLIGAEDRQDCFLVDPLMDFERFLPSGEALADGPRIKYVLDTHVHADHLSGAREVCRLTGAELMMHESAQVAVPFVPIKGGSDLSLCGLRVRVIHTPGHAPEHVSLLVDERILLSGDALLIGDVGRTDLGRGDNFDLYESLHEKLMRLEDTVQVHPAHVGAQHYLSEKLSSTIGEERRSNPALRIAGLDEFRRYMTEGWPPKPANYDLYVMVNRGLLTLREAQAQVGGTLA